MTWFRNKSTLPPAAKQLLDEILQVIQELFNTPHCAILLADPAGKKLYLEAARGYRRRSRKDFSLTIGKQGITGWVAARRRSLYVPEVRKDPRYIEGIVGGESEIAVPLLMGRQLIGVLDIESEKPRAFTKHDLKILGLFATQSAVAIQNARLYQESKRANDYLQKLMESSSDAITTADNRGRLIFWSKGAEEIFGYKASEVLGKSAAEFYAAGKEDARRVMSQLGRKGRLKNVEVEYVGKQGRKIYASLSASLLKDERGRMIGSLGIIRDITPFHVLSQQLVQSERLATIGRLSTQIAHEIMNPLSSIKMNIRILSKREGLSPNDQRRLQIANFEIDHLEKILQDIFDYSKSLQLDFSKENLNEVLEKCFVMVQDHLESGKIQVVKRYQKDLPPAKIDLVRMMQVFTNLLMNSIQAVTRGGKIRIITGLTRHQGARWFSVKITDNGKGIPPALLGSVFEPFYTTKSHGTGLGLTIVRKIMDQHDGRISIRSLPGKFTTFTLLLPFHPSGAARQ
ncbi:MAG: ATP-binding protein [Terriglobia bacterium]